MRWVSLIILFACLKLVHVQDLAVNGTAYVQDSIDNLVNSLTDQLVNRMLVSWPLQETHLESAMLAKASTSTLFNRHAIPCKAKLPGMPAFWKATLPQIHAQAAHRNADFAINPGKSAGARSTRAYSAEASQSELSVDSVAPWGRDKNGNPKALLLWDGA